MGSRTLTFVSAHRDAERSSLWMGPAREFHNPSRVSLTRCHTGSLRSSVVGVLSLSDASGIWPVVVLSLPTLPSHISNDTSTSCHVSFCRKSPISGQWQETPGQSQSPCRPELFVLHSVRRAEDDDSHMTRLIWLSASLLPCGLGVGPEALPVHTSCLQRTQQ